MQMISRLMSLLNRKQKNRVVMITMLIIVGAVLETLGVSAIIPIVQLFMEDESAIREKVYVKWCMELFHIEKLQHVFIAMLIFMIVIYVVKNTYLLFLTYVQNRFVNNNKSDMQSVMLKWYISRPYEFFLKADVSIIQRSVRNDVNNIYAALLCYMQILTEGIVAGCICLFLLVTDWKMTVFLVLLLGIVTVFIIKKIKNPIGRWGRKNQAYMSDLSRWELQSIYGIKDIKVLQKERFFTDGHRDTLNKQSHLLTKYAVLNTMPRLMLETVCICGILGYLVVCVLLGAEVSGMISSLSAFAIAAFRVLPSVSRINTHLSSLAYYKPSLDYIYELLGANSISENRIPAIEMQDKIEPLSLQDKIELKEVTFAYPDTVKLILDKASMEVPIGASVGIKGPSGSGKTTLIDILLGLLEIQSGEICCDGVNVLQNKAAWLAQIGYIPQSIYMMDESIMANVAFGIPHDEIDEKRVREVLGEAQLLDFIDSLPDGMYTTIGEQGVRLSGGQRQRIGIARALYHNPEILLFDEATSALDNDTEAAIMSAIETFKGKKTMIIIAHRLKTIENCDIIYEVNNGKISHEK